jgi:hypothetical protein
MDFVVVDTDGASNIHKDRLTGPLAVRLLGKTLVVTFVTIGELTEWVGAAPVGTQPSSRARRMVARLRGRGRPRNNCLESEDENGSRGSQKRKNL